ncbi:branched-chain amino acid transporter permease [Rhodococcoides kyotonense]|uniref:Branched-chain amino acid transport protein AzlD n=1 Tax=Rhodococcoides kyotonense TaxID=398843 RepID=A0A239KFM8_9NOCA|nr:AzlD domain-containing protein [Rhodococcus kyotonensis]SNT15934.1 Branched-chain amino acid transport protein AzlD [Rhodococcus kyotonensis]
MTTYIAGALGVAVAITFALRAIPFAVRSRLRESALLDSIGKWMTLGAVVILALYALSSIDVSTENHGVPQIAGVLVTVVVHLWRRNAALSIVGGTVVCVVLQNWVL